MLTVIFETALRSAALIGLVWLVLATLRIRNPHLERSVWLGVLAGSIAMPAIMKWATLPTAASSVMPSLPAMSIGELTVGSAVSNWQTPALWIYCCVTAALMLRQFIGTVRLWRLRSAAARGPRQIDSTFDVRMSPDISSPVAVFSTILVPTDFDRWSLEQQAAVLAHEGTHLAHHDFYVQWLAQLHRNIVWINPLAWWLPRRLSLLSEHISDDAALQSVAQRTAYAELLVSFARKAMGDEQVIAMAHKRTLASRVERILENTEASREASRLKKIVSVTLLLPFIAIAAGFTTQGTKEPSAVSTRTDRATTQQSNNPQAIATKRLTAPSSNPQRPLTQPVYPPVSRRLHETGTVVLNLHVLENGKVGDAVVHKSSGFVDLDTAAKFESFRWELEPGTVDGKPKAMWDKFAVTFKLTNDEATQAL